MCFAVISDDAGTVDTCLLYTSDRFPRARLTGKNIESLIKTNLRPADYRNIFN